MGPKRTLVAKVGPLQANVLVLAPANQFVVRQSAFALPYGSRGYRQLDLLGHHSESVAGDPATTSKVRNHGLELRRVFQVTTQLYRTCFSRG